MIKERQIEESLISKLKDLKYTYRDDIRDKASHEENFRENFQRLNKVNLNDAEFARLRDEIITADVFTAAKTFRGEINTFQRENGTPLQYTLVNIKDWCRNEFEVINQLRINTENSYHRYDVIILINGVTVVQIELKSLHVAPKRMTAKEMAEAARKHGLESLGLGWKERTKKELELMADLIPLLMKLAGGRKIAGSAAYE